MVMVEMGLWVVIGYLVIGEFVILAHLEKGSGRCKMVPEA